MVAVKAVTGMLGIGDLTKEVTKAEQYRDSEGEVLFPYGLAQSSYKPLRHLWNMEKGFASPPNHLFETLIYFNPNSDTLL